MKVKVKDGRPPAARVPRTGSAVSCPPTPRRREVTQLKREGIRVLGADLVTRDDDDHPEPLRLLFRYGTFEGHLVDHVNRHDVWLANLESEFAEDRHELASEGLERFL